MEIKKLYDKWKSLKSESINFQRAGIDDCMSEKMHERDNYVYNRIKEVEAELFPLLKDREALVFDNTPIDESERQQDKFYEGGGYLVNWVKVKDTRIRTGDSVSGEVIYAKKPI